MDESSNPPPPLQWDEGVGETSGQTHSQQVDAAAADCPSLQPEAVQSTCPVPHNPPSFCDPADTSPVMEDQLAGRDNDDASDVRNVSPVTDTAMTSLDSSEGLGAPVTAMTSLDHSEGLGAQDIAATSLKNAEQLGGQDTPTAGHVPNPDCPVVSDSMASDLEPTLTDSAAVQSWASAVANSKHPEKHSIDDKTEDQRLLLTEINQPTLTPNGDVDEHVNDGEERKALLHGKTNMGQADDPGSRESGVSAVGEEKELLNPSLQRPKRTCFVLCLSFFFVYTANLAIQNLQTSLHQAAGLGVTSLAVLYGAIIVFGSLSPLVIRFLTAKRTLVVAFICHLLYTVSNFYPTFPTLLTSSLLLGVMAGPMWTAQGLYCTATGMVHAALKQMSDHAALSLFNGVFFAFYESTQISGNLIASLVLTRGRYNDTDASNQTNKVCGAAVCPDTVLNTTKIEQPEKHIVYIMLAIFAACNLLGLLLTVIALPPLPRNEEIQAGESSLKKSTTSCLSMLLVPKMLLLLPFFMAQAMNSGILLAEYNEKFVSCAQGIQWVGFVMAAFGVLTSVQAVALNYAAKLLGRRVLFVSAATADLSVNVAMLAWDPTGASIGLLFVLPCVAGFAEGIFQAQFNSLVAMVFPDQKTGAFATYHTSKATAFTVTFILARFLCLYQRLYLSLTLSVLGLIGYGVVEIMLQRRKESKDLIPGNVAVSSGDDSDRDLQGSRCSDNDQYKKIKSP